MNPKPDYLRKKFAPLLDKTLKNARFLTALRRSFPASAESVFVLFAPT